MSDRTLVIEISTTLGVVFKNPHCLTRSLFMFVFFRSKRVVSDLCCTPKFLFLKYNAGRTPETRPNTHRASVIVGTYLFSELRSQRNGPAHVLRHTVTTFGPYRYTNQHLVVLGVGDNYYRFGFFVLNTRTLYDLQSRGVHRTVKQLLGKNWVKCYRINMSV